MPKVDLRYVEFDDYYSGELDDEGDEYRGGSSFQKIKERVPAVDAVNRLNKRKKTNKKKVDQEEQAN